MSYELFFLRSKNSSSRESRKLRSLLNEYLLTCVASHLVSVEVLEDASIRDNSEFCRLTGNKLFNGMMFKITTRYSSQANYKVPV